MTTLDVMAQGRSVRAVLAWSRSVVEPVLRVAVDTLPSSMRRIAGYHFGWWNEHGHPERASGGKAIRPTLVLLSAQAVGGVPAVVVPASVAVEEETGLVVPGGRRGGKGVRGTISAHRFRHTVGTQLAERGAKLHTIMKVLGHSSVSMALVYAQISDREVLRDYKSILAPGAVIAGPAALEVKSGVLPEEAVHWLKTNFFKTDLELGHCLRLPAEGPCECDLYLTCAKFITTSEYAPRLRARLDVEQQLIQDADQRGWTREAERHTTTAHHIQGLLTDLGATTAPDALNPASIETNTDPTSPSTENGDQLDLST